MNILIVTAHPSPTGLTHAIAKTYADAKRAKKHEVQIIDLYGENYKTELLTFTDIHNFSPSKIQIKFQEQIKWAHEIVVVHPIWWGLPPAIMKSWVELTFWRDFAYRYSTKGKVEKMLLGKTAKIFATSGGFAWYHKLHILPLSSFWKTCVFEFCGIDVVDVKICGKLDLLKGEKREKHIQKFLHKIKKS